MFIECYDIVLKETRAQDYSVRGGEINLHFRPYQFTVVLGIQIHDVSFQVYLNFGQFDLGRAQKTHS